MQVQVRIDRLHGLIPAYKVSQLDTAALRPSALYVEACLCSHSEVLGIPFRTECAEAGLDGCTWDTWLTFPIKARALGTGFCLCGEAQRCCNVALCGTPHSSLGCIQTATRCSAVTTLLLLQYRDLEHATQLALTVWEVREAVGRRPLGGTTFTLFSKKGRLKTGVQLLRLWEGREADVRWRTSTPGKVPVSERGELG